MSVQQMLIPDLNKIMEEFAETEKEITFKLVTTFNGGESQDKIAEAETRAEEGRKRKRVEEEEKQSNGEEIEEFLSYKAYEIKEKKILKKEFIA